MRTRTELWQKRRHEVCGLSGGTQLTVGTDARQAVRLAFVELPSERTRERGEAPVVGRDAPRERGLNGCAELVDARFEGSGSDPGLLCEPQSTRGRVELRLGRVPLHDVSADTEHDAV